MNIKKLIFFSFGLSILLVFATAFFDKGLSFGLGLVTVLSSITFLILNKLGFKGKKIYLLFIIVLIVHLGITLFVHYDNFQPLSGGMGDYYQYHQQAQEVAGRIRQGSFSLQGIDLFNYYSVVIGYIYALTIPSTLVGQLFNVYLIALLIIFVYLIVREIGGTEKEGFLAGLIACFYPSLAFYGSLLLKDASVVLLCMIGLLLMLKIVKSFSIPKFICFFIILTGLTHLRFYVGYALMFGFIISWFLISNLNLKKRVVYGIIMVFILGFCPQILGNGYYGLINLKTYLNVQQITLYREEAYAPKIETITQPSNCEPSAPQLNNCKPAALPTPAHRNSSSVIIKTGFENPITFIRNTFLSFVDVFLGPFPWQVAPLKYLFVLPEMIIWYFLLFSIIKETIESIKKQNKIIFPLIIFSILVIGVLTIYMDNFGIITRIRMPAFLALLCLFPFGLKTLKLPLLKKYLEKMNGLGHLYN